MHSCISTILDMPSNNAQNQNKQTSQKYIYLKIQKKNTESESEEIKARVRREKVGERENVWGKRKKNKMKKKIIKGKEETDR